MTALHYKLIWWAEYGYWAFTVAFALWRGDRTVRAAALVFLVGQAAMFAVQHLMPSPRAGYATFDTLALLALVVLAVRAPQPWLLWASAFQLATVASYVAVLLDPRIRGLALGTAANTWWMLEMSALLWGAIQAHLRRAPLWRDREAAA